MPTAIRSIAFAWKLFELWHGMGAPSKDKWAMAAIGHLGGDACVLKLTPLVRDWPGESQHARAVFGLECLRAVGSDTALMALNGIAQKLKFKGLKQKAPGDDGGHRAGPRLHARAARRPHRARLRPRRARQPRVRLRAAPVPLRARAGDEAAGARRRRQGPAGSSKRRPRRTSPTRPRRRWPSGSS